jgi:hypothetical protein
MFRYVVTFCVVSMFFMVCAVDSAHANPPTPPPPLKTEELAVCKLTCENAVGQAYFFVQPLVHPAGVTKGCPPSPQITYSCAPYACEPTGHTCLTTCNRDSDCSRGNVCNQQMHQCAPHALVCIDPDCPNGIDQTKPRCNFNNYNPFLIDTNGDKNDCTPYRCKSGMSVCPETCDSVDDCVVQEDYVCDSTRFCVPRPCTSDKECLSNHCDNGHCAR